MHSIKLRTRRIGIVDSPSQWASSLKMAEKPPQDQQDHCCNEAQGHPNKNSVNGQTRTRAHTGSSDRPCTTWPGNYPSVSRKRQRRGPRTYLTFLAKAGQACLCKVLFDQSNVETEWISFRFLGAMEVYLNTPPVHYIG